MIKQLTAILLMAAFLLQSMSKALVIVSYYSNKTVYAKNCENKQKPQLHCNGKCQMIKKLKQEQKQDEANPERKLENKNESISFHSYLNIEFSAIQQLYVKTPFGLLNSGQPVNRSYAIFHPPCA
jgi:hypothetical protein